MVGERDPRFYGELKQTNDDLYNYLTKCREKSPYFDYTPTLNDYVKQVGDLLRQYPEKTSSSSIFGQASTSANSLSTTTTATNCISNTNTNSLAPLSVMSSLATVAVTTNNPTSSLANPSSTPFSGSIFQSASPLMAPTSIGSLTSLSQPTTQLSATPSSQTTAPTTKPFTFGSPAALFQTPATSATTNSPLFTFSLPKKDETQTNNNSIISGVNDDTNKTVGDEQDDAPPPEPNVDKYEEKDAKYSVKIKLYGKDGPAGSEAGLNVLGVGYLYVKSYDSPNKLQVIFRQEPDLRRVLLNEIVTPSIPIKRLPQKAIQIVFPSTEGSKIYLFKAKDEKDADDLFNTLNSLKS